MKKISTLAFCFFLFFGFVQGQILFEENYGNAPNFERVNSIIQHDGVVLLAGTTTLETDGGDDMLLVKLDTTGNLIWKKQIGSAKNEQANKIKLADDGYLVAGHTKSLGNGNQDFYLVKTGFDGDIIWERTYGTENLENCTDFIVTPDGGFLLIGNAVHDEVKGEDWWVVKTDAEGNLEWSNYYGGESRDIPTFIKSLQDGGYLLGGGHNGGRMVVKIDAEGNELWNYGLNPSDPIYNFPSVDALEQANGDILIGSLLAHIARVSSDGEEIYQQNLIPGFGFANGLGFVLGLHPVGGDTILMINKVNIFAIDGMTGDTLSRVGWENPDTVYSTKNDVFVAGNKFYVASDHRTLLNESFRHNGILFRKHNQTLELEATYRDTFEFNTYEEYTKKIIETVSGDFLHFGRRKLSPFSNGNQILLTRTDSDGEFVSEVSYDKGYQAFPDNMYYTDLGNLILLTQINEDTMELAMVNSDGFELWSQYIEGEYGEDETVTKGLIKEYLGGNYVLILNGHFYIFNEDGEVAIDYQSNALIPPIPFEATVLPSGRFVLYAKDRMILLEEDASFLSNVFLTPIGYSISEYYGVEFYSEDDIWLIGQASLGASDSAEYVILKTNLEGERLAENTFGNYLKSEITKPKLLDVGAERLLVYGNQKNDNPYGSNVTPNNCLIKPLDYGYLEEWSKTGEILNRINFSEDKGTQLYDMILTTDDDIAGAGWIYDTNSDDQYLVKVNQETFVPTAEIAFKNNIYSLVYPNPGNASLFLDLSSAINGNLKVLMYNSTGELVDVQQFEKNEYATTFELNTGDLPKGIYYIQSIIDDQVRTIDKWIKVGER